MRGGGSPAAARAAGALLGAVALYYAVWAGEYSAFDLRGLRQRSAAEAERLAAVRGEVESLRRLAQALESDPATIERVARERFGMVRDGEVLYRFVEVPPAPARQTASRAP